MIGEVAYTSTQISKMAEHMELFLGEQKLITYAIQHDLLVNVEELNIKLTKNFNAKYWIPKSNLINIIEGMDLPVNEINFTNAAYELGYQL